MTLRDGSPMLYLMPSRSISRAREPEDEIVQVVGQRAPRALRCGPARRRSAESKPKGGKRNGDADVTPSCGHHKAASPLKASSLQLLVSSSSLPREARSLEGREPVEAKPLVSAPTSAPNLLIE